jgi:hypothetical protein
MNFAPFFLESAVDGVQDIRQSEIRRSLFGVAVKDYLLAAGRRRRAKPHQADCGCNPIDRILHGILSGHHLF